MTGGLIASYTVLIPNPEHALEPTRSFWRIAVGVGLLSPLSCTLVLAALATGAPLSLVAPMREMSMMSGALMGMIISRELAVTWRLAGCVILIGGGVLLSSG